MDLQHLAEAEGFQALIALDAKHCAHDDICGTTCALEHHLEETPTDKQKPTNWDVYATIAASQFPIKRELQKFTVHGTEINLG